jgi:DNA-3-methyladenine glycosylase
LGITIEHTGLSLMNGQIWIEDHGTDVADDAVTIGPRVGVDYAGEDALRPYRFRLSKLQAESLV